MSKNFLLTLVAIALILGGIFVVSSKKSATPSSGSGATSHIQGAGKKGVTLVEYGDYQCPVCGAYYSAVKEVVTKYGDDIYFQFRNLPLSQIHQNAFAGARAAEAAGLQGKYFEMHDLLYEGQQSWSTSSSPNIYFDSYAKQLGLDLNKFHTDYASAVVNSAINADVEEFLKTKNEEATPTFFLDGKKLENTQLVDNNLPSVAKFSALIDAEIAKKNP